MNKSFVYKTLLIGLAAVGLSLLTFLCYSVFPPSDLVGAAAFDEPSPTPTATLTPIPTPTATPAPRLTIAKGVTLVNDLDDDGVIDPGDTIKCIITYENTGDADATKVTIVDDYGQALIDSVAEITPEGKDNGDTITWDLGTVPARNSGSVTYKATLDSIFPPGSTNVTNKATMRVGETVLGSATKSFAVRGPLLSIKKEATLVGDIDDNGVIDPGDTIEYTITYENSGVNEATNVTIVDDYDQILIVSILDISDDGKTDGDAITWNIDRVAAETGGLVHYQATLSSSFPPGSTEVVNTVTVLIGETELGSVVTHVDVAGPNLTIKKGMALVGDVDGDGVIDPGDTVKYTITYENIGNVGATNVTIVDEYDQTLIASIDNISADGKDNEDTITWSIETVAAGASGSVTYEATLSSNFRIGSTEVVNTTTIDSTETEPASVTASVGVEVLPTPTPEPPKEEGPATGVFRDKPEWVIGLIAFLAIVAMGVLLYVGSCAKYRSDGEEKVGVVSTPTPEPTPKPKEKGPVAEKPCEYELNRQRIEMVREGVFLIFIVSSILILAMGEAIEKDGAISILSAIIGYVFGRAVTRPTS